MLTALLRVDFRGDCQANQKKWTKKEVGNGFIGANSKSGH